MHRNLCMFDRLKSRICGSLIGYACPKRCPKFFQSGCQYWYSTLCSKCIYVLEILSQSYISSKYFQISARFLKQDKKTADLVGNEKLKASASVRHLVLPCTRSARAQLIPDIISCYSQFVTLGPLLFCLFTFLCILSSKLYIYVNFRSGGRTIIFTETKESASELAGLLTGARALHGDIAQAQREVSRVMVIMYTFLITR